MRASKLLILTLLSAASVLAAKKEKKEKEPVLTPLDIYVQQAHAAARQAEVEDPGSLFTGMDVLADLSSDVKARYVNDIVTIFVDESANAVSTGVTKTQRASNASAGFSSAAGKFEIPGRLGNIITANGSQSLNGQGTTTRSTVLTTTLSARVVDVLPNGFLVIEGSRNVLVNSENQVVTLRGVVRPNDLSRANTVSSAAVAQMELKINGKGVVNDSIRRPNFLYRLLLGILPF